MRGGEGRTRRRFLLGALGALPGLVACSLPGQRPAPPPTPIPTPTATPAPPPSTPPPPLPVPTPGTIATPSASNAPRPAATATATGVPLPTGTPSAALRGAGTLLYVEPPGGNGAGVVLATADGAQRRLLLPGDYGWVNWSPHGGLFAATNPFNAPATRVDLFDAEGRARQRVALEGRLYERPKWTRAGGHLLATVTVPTNGDPGARPVRSWIIGEGSGRSSGLDGVTELDFGDDTYMNPWDWSATGRLAVATTRSLARNQPAWDSGAAQLWTVGATGDDARLLADGRYAAGGWSPDGQTLYARGEFLPVRDPDGTQYAVPTTLYAIDAQGGAVRRLVGIAEIATRLTHLGAAPPRPLRAIQTALPAPTPGRIALWCALEPDPADARRGLTTFVLVIVDDDGRVVWWDGPPQPPVAFLFPAWSPIGGWLAYGYGDKAALLAARVLSIADHADFTVPLGALDTPQWSPDGSFLAVQTRRGVEVVSAAPPEVRALLTATGRSPSWRPRGG